MTAVLRWILQVSCSCLTWKWRSYNRISFSKLKIETSALPLRFLILKFLFCLEKLKKSIWKSAWIPKSNSSNAQKEKEFTQKFTQPQDIWYLSGKMKVFLYPFEGKAITINHCDTQATTVFSPFLSRFLSYQTFSL